MSNTRITARITDQQIELINVPVIASGSEAMLQIVCEFCELWKGYAKTAVFYKDKRQVFHVPLQTLGNQTQCLATVPYEVLAEEGHFYFGVLGILENTRTTEVIHLQVKQGAICASTAEPQDPTPDIYQQLLAAYGDINNRFSEFIAMRGISGATEHTIGDEYINGKLLTNGASAYVDLRIENMSLAEGGWHYTDYCIPPELAPFYMVLLTTSNPDINVTIDNLKSSGWCRLLIENVGNQMLTTDDVVFVFGAYPLTSVFIAELADARVGADGKTYPTVGDAIREQISRLKRLPTIGEVTIKADKWVGTASPYHQVVSINGVTENSQVDLTPSIEQLAIFHHKDLAFVTENVDGEVTVYALGDKPANDYTIQVTITEVDA